MNGLKGYAFSKRVIEFFYLTDGIHECHLTPIHPP